MTVGVICAALLAGLAACLWLWPNPARLGAGAAGHPEGPAHPTPGPRTGRAPGMGTDVRHSPGLLFAVGSLAGLAAWLLVGGVVGATMGIGLVVAVPPVIGRLEPARARRERLELVRAAPLVADLLSAALLAGVPLEPAIPVVARAIGGAAGRRLQDVHRRTELGEPMARAFQDLGLTPGLGGIARAVARSSRTGAPVAALLAQTATDLRADATAAGLEQVRGTAVRAVLPLGLCLLPAFTLLGIVPIVGGLLPSF